MATQATQRKIRRTRTRGEHCKLVVVSVFLAVLHSGTMVRGSNHGSTPEPWFCPCLEIEQLLFTRGGPVGDQRDNFDGMTAQQRIAHLASNRHWTFFEVRNTIKHRAHKLAYLKVALHFIEVGTDADLSRKIADNITYEDWGRGQRLNLWRVVLESEQSKSNVATQ